MYIARRNCKILKLLLVVLVVIPVIYTGAWLSHQSTTKCERKLNNPFLIIGIFIFLLSLAYFICIFIINPENHQLFYNYLSFGLLVLFLVLLGYTIFALVVTTKTKGGDTEESEYSKWMQNLVLNNNHWRNIKDCLIFQTKVCSSFINEFKDDSYQQFQSRHFSSVQSGCCKPLKECNFTYTSPAVWTKPSNNGTISNADCNEWSNDPFVLCFNCQSCKDGFVHDINTYWKKAALVNIVVIFSLAMLCWCGDCGPDPQDDNQ